VTETVVTEMWGGPFRPAALLAAALECGAGFSGPHSGGPERAVPHAAFAQPSSQQSQPLLAALLARGAAYVEQYKTDFALVISDEDYTQRISGPRVAHVKARERRTRAEMLSMWMPDEQAWLTVRNVLSVDRRAVGDGQGRFTDLLRESVSDPAARLRRLRELRDESARFNLGTIFRNMNYPVLVLQFLEPRTQARFLFLLVGRETIADVPAWHVRYFERQQPTFIQGENGMPRPASGGLWLTEADGAVIKSELHLAIVGTMAAVTVDYRRDARLNMWVPSRMQETYIDKVGDQEREKITCVATYSNFRRFETSARVIP
jgi:hypothetical protein